MMAQTRLEIWVDADRDAVVVEASSDQEFGGAVSSNRREDAGRSMFSGDMFWGSERPRSYGGLDGEGVPPTESPSITTTTDPVLRRFQDARLDDFPGRINPLQDRAFGCVLACAGAERVDDNSLLATPSLTARFEIAAHTTPAAETAQVWIDDANALLADAASASLESRRAARDAYWQALASRSWIRFSPNYGAEATDEERAAPT